MGCNLLTNGVYWGYNPLILTFDPNFLRHPSRGVKILQQWWQLFRNISKLVVVEPLIKQMHACENGWRSCMFDNSWGETNSHIFDGFITFLNLCILLWSENEFWYDYVALGKTVFSNSSAIIAFKWYASSIVVAQSMHQSRHTLLLLRCAQDCLYKSNCCAISTKLSTNTHKALAFFTGEAPWLSSLCKCLLLLKSQIIHVSCQIITIVGGFNPFEKYARQIGSFPQFSGWKSNIFESTTQIITNLDFPGNFWGPISQLWCRVRSRKKSIRCMVDYISG